MAWDNQVAEEDVSLVQSVQRGLESGAVPQGRLMGESEKLIADFQRRVRDALTAYGPQAASEIVDEAVARFLESVTNAAGSGRSSLRAFPRLLERAVANALGNLLVRITEGHAIAHERLGSVGREQQRIGGCLRHAAAIDLEPA